MGDAERRVHERLHHRDLASSELVMAWPVIDQATVEGIGDELGTRREPQLLLYVRPVRLHRSHGQKQLLGYLGIGVPEGDQTQHLDLALREIVRRTRRRLGGDAGAEARV